MAKRYYILAILAMVSTVNTLDRQILSILVEPIRQELRATDTQMGMLTGIAFAIVYATLCIPAARLGDHFSRSKFVACAIGFWSVMTMLCGAAQSYVQLFIARFLVGAGEAAGSPHTQALVSDLFPRKGRATAMALLLVSVPFGLAAGLSMGGWAAERYGWRSAFLLAGVPGLLLVPLLLFTVPRIPKGMADGLETPPAHVPFLKSVRTLWLIRTYPLILLGGTLQALVSMGFNMWMPAFLARSHGMELTAIGAAMGAAYGTGSLIGHFSGGPLMDWLGARDPRRQFWFQTGFVLAAGSFAAAAFLVPLEYVFLLVGFQAFFGSLFAAPMIAIITTLAPIALRATALAIMQFVLNIFGLGLGPVLVGWISDLLKDSFGGQSLRISLLCATTVAIPSALCYFLASRFYREDLAAAVAPVEGDAATSHHPV